MWFWNRAQGGAWRKCRDLAQARPTCFAMPHIAIPEGSARDSGKLRLAPAQAGASWRHARPCEIGVDAERGVDCRTGRRCVTLIACGGACSSVSADSSGTPAARRDQRQPARVTGSCDGKRAIHQPINPPINPPINQPLTDPSQIAPWKESACRWMSLTRSAARSYRTKASSVGAMLCQAVFGRAGVQPWTAESSRKCRAFAGRLPASPIRPRFSPRATRTRRQCAFGQSPPASEQSPRNRPA